MVSWNRGGPVPESSRRMSRRHCRHVTLFEASVVSLVAFDTLTMCLGYMQNMQFPVARRNNFMVIRPSSHSLQRHNSKFSKTPPSPILRLSKSSNPQDFDFKEFDIDDILSEAEDALKAAEQSLESENDSKPSKPMPSPTRKISVKPTSTEIDPDTKRSSQQQAFAKSMDAENLKNSIASTMGGMLFGSVFGSVANFQLPGLLSALESDDNIVSPILVFPLLGGLVLGTLGLIGSLQNNILGTVTKNLLAVPLLALVSFILSSIQGLFASLQSAAQQQVEKTANDIKSLPQNLANSAQQTVKSTVDSAVEEVTSLPRKARDKVVQTSVQAADSVKSSVVSAVQEVTSLPAKARDNVVQSGTQAVESVKSLPRKAKDTVMDSGVLSRDFLLALVVIPSLIALGFLALDALFAGRVPSV